MNEVPVLCWQAKEFRPCSSGLILFVSYCRWGQYSGVVLTQISAYVYMTHKNLVVRRIVKTMLTVHAKSGTQHVSNYANANNHRRHTSIVKGKHHLRTFYFADSFDEPGDKCTFEMRQSFLVFLFIGTHFWIFASTCVWCTCISSTANTTAEYCMRCCYIPQQNIRQVLRPVVGNNCSYVQYNICNIIGLCFYVCLFIFMPKFTLCHNFSTYTFLFEWWMVNITHQ